MSRKPTDTKERILDTATNLFGSYGYAGTAIDDILTAVGITKGAFYHYFKSKEHLCRSALEQAIEQTEAAGDICRGEPAPNKSRPRPQDVLRLQMDGPQPHWRLLVRLTVDCGELSGAAQNRLKHFWLGMQDLHAEMIAAANGQPPQTARRPARLLLAVQLGAFWLDRCAASEHDQAALAEYLLKQIMPGKGTAGER